MCSEMIPKPAFLQNREQHSAPDYQRKNAATNRPVHFKKFARPTNFSSRSSGGFKRGASNSNGHGNRFNSHQNHNDGNIRCNFKGCKFSGPPDVVKFHSDIQHLELRNKYSNVDFTLNTPEDIAKWKAERRSRYPTLEKVEKKEADGDARRQSANNDNFHHISRNTARREQSNWKNGNSQRNSKRQYNNHHSQHPNSNFSNKKICTEDSACLSAEVRHTDEAGNASELPLKKLDSEHPVPIVGHTSHSLNLLSCYESDEETDNQVDTLGDGPTIEEDKLRIQADQTKSENIEEAIQGVVSDLLSQVEKNVKTAAASNCSTQSKQQKKKAKRPPSGPPLNFSRLTLFQKLMLQDVRKVKPDLIECLQLIVDNNFLQDN